MVLGTLTGFENQFGKLSDCRGDKKIYEKSTKTFHANRDLLHTHTALAQTVNYTNQANGKYAMCTTVKEKSYRFLRWFHAECHRKGRGVSARKTKIRVIFQSKLMTYLCIRWKYFSVSCSFPSNSAVLVSRERYSFRLLLLLLLPFAVH